MAVRIAANFKAVAQKQHFQFYKNVSDVSLVSMSQPNMGNLTIGFTLFQEQHFINDTLRSEFHKKFMQKYVKQTMDATDT